MSFEWPIGAALLARLPSVVVDYSVGPQDVLSVTSGADADSRCGTDLGGSVPHPAG